MRQGLRAGASGRGAAAGQGAQGGGMTGRRCWAVGSRRSTLAAGEAGF